MRNAIFATAAFVLLASPSLAANIDCDVLKDGAKVDQCVLDPAAVNICEKAAGDFKLRCFAGSFSSLNADLISCEIGGLATAFAPLDVNSKSSQEELAKAAASDINFIAKAMAYSTKTLKQSVYSLGATVATSRLTISCRR